MTEYDSAEYASDSSDSDTSYSGSEEEVPEIPIYGKSKKARRFYLSTVQQGRDQKFFRWMLGKRPKGKQLKYQKANARVLTIVQGYQGRDATEYLLGIAHNFIMED
uniref:Uncharacterized protein n=1 Tax=Ditylenchus dipsaci TaxID=166011 RepID=A0A915DSZ0_9BILA